MPPITMKSAVIAAISIAVFTQLNISKTPCPPRGFLSVPPICGE
jgi:hypothetical protein